MKILFALSGSTSNESPNTALLNAIRDSFADSYTIEVFDVITQRKQINSHT